jgi:hypothetical protein
MRRSSHDDRKGDSVKSPKKSPVPLPDVLVANAGTVFTFCPLTTRAKKWIEENVESESWQWLGATLVVDHGYALGLAERWPDLEVVVSADTGVEEKVGAKMNHITTQLGATYAKVPSRS